jgi:hypothetical protein
LPRDLNKLLKTAAKRLIGLNGHSEMKTLAKRFVLQA